MSESQNIERLLEILSTVDPRQDSFSDNEELQSLYNTTLAVRPKLVKLIEKYSLKKGNLCLVLLNGLLTRANRRACFFERKVYASPYDV